MKVIYKFINSTLLFFAISCSAGVFEDGLIENDRGDYQSAFNIWIVGAKDGDPMSQFAVATLYRKGVGVEKNLKESAKWMQKSAEGGYVEAMSVMGAIHLWGVSGVSADIEKSIFWFEKAAETGTHYEKHAVAALYGTAELKGYDLNDKKRLYWSKQSANFYRSHYVLGNIYYRGKAVEKNLIKSWVWFKLYAESEIEDKTYLEIEQDLTEEEMKEGEALLVKAKEDINTMFE